MPPNGERITAKAQGACKLIKATVFPKHESVFVCTVDVFDKLSSENQKAVLNLV